MKFFSFVFLLICLYGCREVVENTDVLVISLNPDAAKPFVASEFFDGYRIFTFKDIICTKIGDFVQVKDKIVASSVVRQGFSDSVTICVFDTAGHYLYSLGAVGRGPGEYLGISHFIELTRDTTLFIKSSLGWLEYTINGQLLRERRITKLTREIWGVMQWRINDSTLLYITSTDIKENREKAPMLQLISMNDFHVKRSFFPLEPTKEYITQNLFYALKDTTCVFVDFNNCIYTIQEDTVVPRYKLDKGKYAALTPIKMIEENITVLSNSIRLKKLSENQRYVIGEYILNQEYYFFLFDRRLHKTFDLKSQLEDDILFGKISKLFFYWKPGVQIDDEYMYFYFTPLKFSQLIKSVQKNLSEAEWKTYRQKHPDLMKVYQELNEDCNTIIIGYRFK